MYMNKEYYFKIHTQDKDWNCVAICKSEEGARNRLLACIVPHQDFIWEADISPTTKEEYLLNNVDYDKDYIQNKQELKKEYLIPIF